MIVAGAACAAPSVRLATAPAGGVAPLTAAAVDAHPAQAPEAAAHLAQAPEAAQGDVEPAAEPAEAAAADDVGEAEDAAAAGASWQPPDAPRQPFVPDVERWRPLVRELLAEAWHEGRLQGPAAALDDDLVLAVIQQESDGNPEALSPAGAIGLMQVMPYTFAHMMTDNAALVAAIDPAFMWDVPSNVRAGLRYLTLAMQYHGGHLYWSLASYNAGIGTALNWRAAGHAAVPAFGAYVETANYAPAILRRYADHRPGLEVYIPEPIYVAPVVVAAPPRPVAVAPRAVAAPRRPAPRPQPAARTAGVRR